MKPIEQPTIIRTIHDKETPYVLVNKKISKDTSLTLAAKGLLFTFLSMPSNWRIYLSDIVNRSADGYGRVKSAFDCLIENGYVKRKRIQGGWLTHVYESPRKGRGTACPSPQESRKNRVACIHLFPISFQNNERFQDAWKTYMEARKSVHKNPITERKACAWIKRQQIEQFTVEEVTAALFESVNKGWIGYFPRKGQAQSFKNNVPQYKNKFAQSLGLYIKNKGYIPNKAGRIAFANTLMDFVKETPDSIQRTFGSPQNMIDQYFSFLSERKINTGGQIAVGSKPWSWFIQSL